MVIVIIMAVMANTMAMTARERYAEYATLKALGFGTGFVALLIFGESLGIALLGGALGIALTFPLAQRVRAARWARCSRSSTSRGETVLLQVGAALVVGVVAAAIPAWRAARVRIVDGLRAIGVSARWRIPLTYIARNLLARRLTTVLTAGGMALVVFVFATVLMLAAGLEEDARRRPARTTTSS